MPYLALAWSTSRGAAACSAVLEFGFFQDGHVFFAVFEPRGRVAKGCCESPNMGPVSICTVGDATHTHSCTLTTPSCAFRCWNASAHNTTCHVMVLHPASSGVVTLKMIVCGKLTVGSLWRSGLAGTDQDIHGIVPGST